MSDKLYDILNKVQRWLCAVGAAYVGLAAVWGFPFPDQINETVSIVAALLATSLEIACATYNKKKETGE